jgi:hypothetical protein
MLPNPNTRNRVPSVSHICRFNMGAIAPILITSPAQAPSHCSHLPCSGSPDRNPSNPRRTFGIVAGRSRGHRGRGFSARIAEARENNQRTAISRAAGRRGYLGPARGEGPRRIAALFPERVHWLSLIHARALRISDAIEYLHSSAATWRRDEDRGSRGRAAVDRASLFIRARARPEPVVPRRDAMLRWYVAARATKRPR